MGLIDNLTELVVGRYRANLTERRRLEKYYEGFSLEKNLSEVKEVSFETPSTCPDDSKSLHLRLGSFPATVPEEGTLRRSRPILERSQSEIPEPKDLIHPSPSGPPDLTAVELSPEQLKRTYSHDNVWDHKAQPLPPLPKMVGIGYYRRAADATLEWQTNRLIKRNHGLHGSIADIMTDLPGLAIEPEALASYREYGIQSDSFTSSRSSKSEISDSAVEEWIDQKTGERISTGFVPSRESSAASSFKESFALSRKNSSLSMTSISGNVYQMPVKPPSRKLFRTNSESNSFAALTTIAEIEDKEQQRSDKMERTCEVDEERESKKTAVFDDSSDGEENGEWLDVLSMHPGIHRPGLLSQKRKGVVSGAALKRSTTIKPASRPNLRRGNSRNLGSNQTKKPSTKDQVLPRWPTAKRTSSRAKVVTFAEPPAEHQESSTDPGLYMKECKAKLALSVLTELNQNVMEENSSIPTGDDLWIGSESTAVTDTSATPESTKIIASYMDTHLFPESSNTKGPCSEDRLIELTRAQALAKRPVTQRNRSSTVIQLLSNRHIKPVVDEGMVDSAMSR